MTVPDPGVKTSAVPFQAVGVDEFTFNVLKLPSKEPDVRVISPVKVWVPEFRSSAPPPVPLMVSPPAVIFPVKSAVPPVLFIKTTADAPEVEKVPIFCATGPEMVIGELPPVKFPPLTKLPKKVSPKLAVARVPPELMFKAAATEPFPICFAPFSVMVPGVVPLIMTPPVAVKVEGHSAETVRDELPALY